MQIGLSMVTSIRVWTTVFNLIPRVRIDGSVLGVERALFTVTDVCIRGDYRRNDFYWAQLGIGCLCADS